MTIQNDCLYGTLLISVFDKPNMEHLVVVYDLVSSVSNSVFFDEYLRWILSDNNCSYLSIDFLVVGPHDLLYAEMLDRFFQSLNLFQVGNCCVLRIKFSNT